MVSKVEEMKKESITTKKDISTLQSSLEKLKGIETDIVKMKKDDAGDKLSTLEKEILSLRVDHEKSLKEVKSLSTEVKFFDSSIKKETANSKSELNSLTKSIKGKVN
jgi:hypothetical protein